MPSLAAPRSHVAPLRHHEDMCELLGMCFNRPVDAKLSFGSFRRRGRIHRDGWGIAQYLPDGEAEVVKEPRPASESRLAEQLVLCNDRRSRIFIGHVRLASVGKLSRENTHPFVQRSHFRSWVFAHNGTMGGTARAGSYKGTSFEDLEISPMHRFAGQTDSERLFCHFATILDQSPVYSVWPMWLDWFSEWFLDRLRNLNEFGTLNCLFSEGRRLIAYRDRHGYGSLSILRRKAPFGSIRIPGEQSIVHLDEQKSPDQEGYVIATTPLTDELWEPIPPGDLIVIENGRLHHRSIYGAPA